MIDREKLRYLVDLLSMCEASEAYHDEDEWAMAAVARLRKEINDEMERDQ